MSAEDHAALKRQIDYINKHTARVKRKLFFMKIKHFLGFSIEKEAQILFDEQVKVTKMAKELFRRLYGDEALARFSAYMRSKHGDLNGIW